MDTAASPAFAVRLEAADGYPLQATCHAPTVEPAGRLIVAGATGVAQRFYGRFAAFAAAQGVETWTLDYRGIGQSRPPSLRGFRMDYLDWARLDLAALVDHVAARGRGPLWMVAHSFGGQAFGLLPGTERVQRLVTFGTGAGWHGWMPPLERLRVLFLWNVAGPALVRARGYLAWRPCSPKSARPSSLSTPSTTAGPCRHRATPSWRPTAGPWWSGSTWTRAASACGPSATSNTSGRRPSTCGVPRCAGSRPVARGPCRRRSGTRARLGRRRARGIDRRCRHLAPSARSDVVDAAAASASLPQWGRSVRRR